MIKRILRRSAREPITCIAAILFAAILTVILCYLHQSQKTEQQNYENTFHSIPVEFEITKLNGNRLDESAHIDGYMADLFFENSVFEPNFSELVSDVQVRMSHSGTLIEEQEENTTANEAAETQKITKRLVGITSVKVAEELTPEFGGMIEWYDGYDESIFGSDQFVCVVPSNYIDIDEVVLSFNYRADGETRDREYTCSFVVAGRYTDEGNNKLYCPYTTMEHIYSKLSEPKKVQYLMGKLSNNDNLELLHEIASNWFAEPNPMGDPTPWEKYGYEYYPFAMDIKDSLLKSLVSDMQNSMTINRIAAALVFVLSAGAGFLTGFLVIRSRKREIALMRTLGTSNRIVCMELEIEQILCVAAGVIIGGSYSLWEPLEQLCLFAGIYIAGLTAALLVFIRANLLATMKEDE